MTNQEKGQVARAGALTEIVCKKCHNVFIRKSPSQIYCGSRKERTGCAHIHSLESQRISEVNTKADPITMAEVNDAELYKDNFKDRCASCGTGIPATWNNYKLRGNYCMDCSVKARKNIVLNT